MKKFTTTLIIFLYLVLFFIFVNVLHVNERCEKHKHIVGDSVLIENDTLNIISYSGFF